MTNRNATQSMISLPALAEFAKGTTQDSFHNLRELLEVITDAAPENGDVYRLAQIGKTLCETASSTIYQAVEDVACRADG